MDRGEEANHMDWWTSLEGLNVPLLLIDHENTITKSTQAARSLLGYTQHQLQGQTLVQLTHPDYRNEETNMFIDIFYGGKKGGDLSKKFLTPNNGVKSLRQRMFPLTEEETTTHALVYLTQDSDRRSTTELIEQLKYTLELFDTGEFNTDYNTSVVLRARRLLAELDQKSEVKA